MKKYAFLLLLLLASGLISASNYPRLILAGDYPDPTVLRDGKDYYMTHSPFHYAPGFLIWHSTDLVNWQPLCRALTQWEGSAMAPDLVKHDGRYYIYFPAAGTNWVTWADDIRGPWSEPIDLKVGGIDPGHVVDNDGKRYLYLNDGHVVQLADDGLSTVGEVRKVYEGWPYPANWKTEGMYLESPKLFKRGEYFYLISAEGGTAGPPTSHAVVVARSKSVLGPWENSPFNPLVHTFSVRDKWWSKGHGTLVDDAEGNWWVIYHAYANGYHTLGRQTLMEPVEWTADGWCRPVSLHSPTLPERQPDRHGLRLSDDFSSPTLGLQWTFWKEYAPRAANVGGGVLRLKAKGKTPADARLLLTTAEHKNYEALADITVGRGNTAGLLLYYNEEAYAGLLSDGKTFTLCHPDGQTVSLPNRLGKNFTARLRNRGNHLAVQVSTDRKQWTTLAEDIDLSSLHHNNHGGFYALRIALASMGKGEASFRQFTYKDGVPTEADMGAYLLVFHQDETHSLHAALSRDGYTFTALNEGRPIIAGDTIAEQRGIRDPHIYRGPDGAFYLAMTDLHIYAQREGYRDTEWERDGASYGWGNNRGLVLMKSWDLIHWSRANIRFDRLTAGLSEIGCAWAPETTYDERTGRLMIYYTMRFRTEPNRLYYVYVNEAYNQVESLPQPLYEYPDETVSAIDGDITRVGDRYHLFYVAHEENGGIKHATSDRINTDYRYDPRWYDFEPFACEAPNVWKRIGEDKWVLMYDIYSITPHNFGFAETTDFNTFTNLGHFNEGVMKTTNFTSPKHGAVIHLTTEEADRLEEHWNR